ncbi:MAG: hypothetical protein R6W70_05535 [bacterium]
MKKVTFCFLAILFIFWGCGSTDDGNGGGADVSPDDLEGVWVTSEGSLVSNTCPEEDDEDEEEFEPEYIYMEPSEGDKIKIYNCETENCSEKELERELTVKNGKTSFSEEDSFSIVDETDCNMNMDMNISVTFSSASKASVNTKVDVSLTGEDCEDLKEADDSEMLEQYDGCSMEETFELTKLS